MAGTDADARDGGGYVVFRRVGDDQWCVVGDVGRRPGLTARAARVQAVKDACGGDMAAGVEYAVVPRSEWRVARQL